MNRERKASLQVRSPWRGLCVSTLAMALMTLQGTTGASAMEGVLRGSFDHPDVMVLDRPVLAGMRLRTGLGALASQADPGIVLTLRRALGTDLGLRKSIADSQAARAGVWSAMAAYVPTINGTVARSYFKDTTLSGRQTSETMSLDASVTLLDMGTRYFGVKRAKAESLAADYRVLAEENSVLAEAAAAYLDLLLARKRSQTLKSMRANIAHLVDLTGRAQSRGFADTGDVALARAELSFIESDLEAARTAEEKAGIRYRSITGLQSLPPDMAYHANAIGLGEQDIEYLIQTAMRRNPRIRASFASASAAGYAARETFGKYLPKVSMYASYEQDRLKRTDDTWSIGVRLNVPLLDARSMPDVQRARFETAAATYAAQDMRHEVERELRQAWSDYVGLSGQGDATDKAVSALEKATDVKRRQYRSGFASLRDVLQAERDLLDARLKRDQILAQRDTAAYRLIIETGLRAARNTLRRLDHRTGAVGQRG